MTMSAANSMNACEHAFTGWNDVIEHHAMTYPHATAQDWYKLIFQGTLGAEHLLGDVEKARQRLEAEWASLSGPVVPMPPSDVIAPQGALLRLHLRPLKALGCPLHLVWDAFAGSAQIPKPPKENFMKIWQALPGWRALADYQAWDRAMAARGYDACHHSQAYRDAYNPSYRVVHRPSCAHALHAFLQRTTP